MSGRLGLADRRARPGAANGSSSRATRRAATSPSTCCCSPTSRTRHGLVAVLAAHRPDLRACRAPGKRCGVTRRSGSATPSGSSSCTAREQRSRPSAADARRRGRATAAADARPGGRRRDARRRRPRLAADIIAAGGDVRTAGLARPGTRLPGAAPADPGGGARDATDRGVHRGVAAATTPSGREAG